MFLLDIKIMQQFLRAVIFRAYNVHKEICQLARINFRALFAMVYKFILFTYSHV